MLLFWFPLKIQSTKKICCATISSFFKSSIWFYAQPLSLEAHTALFLRVPKLVKILQLKAYSSLKSKIWFPLRAKDNSQPFKFFDFKSIGLWFYVVKPKSSLLCRGFNKQVLRLRIETPFIGLWFYYVKLRISLTFYFQTYFLLSKRLVCIRKTFCYPFVFFCLIKKFCSTFLLKNIDQLYKNY